MTLKLYMDVHVPMAVTEGLRLRGVDVLTCYDDGKTRTTDDEVLQRATVLYRVLFTQDSDLLQIAAAWQERARKGHSTLAMALQASNICSGFVNVPLPGKRNAERCCVKGICSVPFAASIDPECPLMQKIESRSSLRTQGALVNGDFTLPETSTCCVPNMSQQSGQPSGKGSLAESLLAVLEIGDAAEWRAEIVVVKDENAGQFLDCRF